MVFCILVETTRPTFSLRREVCASGVCDEEAGAAVLLVVSAMISPSSLSCGRCECFLPAQRLDALDVTEALLEADAEELFGGLQLLALELVVTEVANLFDFHCIFLELLKLPGRGFIW